MEREKVGAVGTGKFEGYVWDGHHWVDPFTMKHGKFDSWQRTNIWWKAFVIVGCTAMLVVVSLPFID